MTDFYLQVGRFVLFCVCMERLNGELITEYLKKPGASYGGMAAELGVSPSLLRQMEEGYLPRKGWEKIKNRLAQVLGVSVGALTLGADEAKRA